MIKPPLVQVFFDYTDPFSYLMEMGLRERLAKSEFEMDRIPFEETPPPRPLLDPHGDPFGPRWEAAEKAAQPLGVSLVRPWIVPWTRKAHELAAFAETKNCFEEIHEKLFRAYLSEGLDIGRVDVLVAIGREVGLDPMEAKAALDVDQFSHLIAERRSQAAAAGVSRVPTLLLGGSRTEGYTDGDMLAEFLATGREPET